MFNLKLPKQSEVNLVVSSFSKKEKILFGILSLVLLVTTVAILESINKHFMVNIPERGGSVSIGIADTPRFVNPILASSPADQSLVSLIYSGLMRQSPDGTLIPDLASKYEKSKDGLSYTFILKDKIYFQNGEAVTPDDIIFTITKVKDSVIKSPYKVNWDGVNVEKIDEKTIKFTLKQPYVSFLENTTLGIMPARLWSDSPIELNNANTAPIGSGPYQIEETRKQSSGIIDSFKLKSFEKFALGQPYLKNINLYFYHNEDEAMTAFRNQTIDQISSLTPENARALEKEGHRVSSSLLPRVFGLFFNQNVNNIFVDKNVVRAINQAIDKEKIVNEVLLGYGVAINNPIPPNISAQPKSITNTNTSRKEIIEKVKGDLLKAGWKPGTDGFVEKIKKEKKGTTTTKLEFSISTGNAPELAKTAELIKQDLALVGIKVDVKTFETGNLNQSVIRPRKYEALLFGQIINHESDLFAFWHSSQRNDPGLNISLYTNAKVDKILETAGTTESDEERIKKYSQFQDEIQKDMPAVFLYSPHLIYVVSKDLKNFSMDKIISGADRYLNAYLWYKDEENVWKIFAN